MLAVRARAAGGPEVLECVDIPTPAPKAGEILIRHEAIGLNFIDTYQRSGLYPIRLPAVLGLEGAGTVEAVGEGVTRFKMGDQAAYAGRPGAYAEAQVVPEDRAVQLPPGVTSEVAGASLLRGMTAEFLLRRCRPVRAGDVILVHAAAGGVGGILAQWAKALGATVIGTAGSAAKADLARSMGCDHVILYGEEIVAERVRAITGGAGVAVAYDGVGAATFDGTLASLARRGAFVSFGNASGPPPPVEPQRLARGGSLFFTRPTLFDYIATTVELDDSARAFFAVIQSGAVKIDIGQKFPLAEAARAHTALESRQTHGASVLIP
jgi:NADPH2:quinone reductase